MKRNPPSKIPTTKAPIKKYSHKRFVQNEEYIKARKLQLKDKPFCEIKLPGCTGFATEVHHMKGRIGELLTDMRYFKSICHSCHEWITEHSKEAIELGFSISRLN